MNQSTNNFYKTSQRTIMYCYLIITILSSCVALCHADMSACEDDASHIAPYVDQRQYHDAQEITGYDIENYKHFEDESVVYGADDGTRITKDERGYRLITPNGIVVSGSFYFWEILADYNTVRGSEEVWEDGTYRMDDDSTGCLIGGICD